MTEGAPDPNPSSQYATDANLAARQLLWETAVQDPPFDLFAWVLGLAGLGAGGEQSVLDVGCGNGLYEARLLDVGHLGPVTAIDLSPGMLAQARRSTSAEGAPAGAPTRSPSGEGGVAVGFARADAQRLPFRGGAFDVVLAPHMLYHVPDIAAAAIEMRRALRPDGVCVVVTNGCQHAGALRVLVEEAAGGTFEMRSPASERFSLENGAPLLRAGFADVQRVDAAQAPVLIGDAEVVAGYVASIGDHYGPQVEDPWPEVVERARLLARTAMAAADGALAIQPVVGAFVCR